MATGAKMSYNFYQSGKFGTLPQNPQKDMEVTQDMHLKMSKKIAQLTKVIYALNTKNDEHDAILQACKDQHEEQMQQLMAETKNKIEYYKQKVSGEVSQIKRIEELEKCISEHEKQKITSLRDFEVFRKQSEAKEVELKTKHSEKMLTLAQEVLKVKKEFETRLQQVNELKDKYERDKEEALASLQQQHQKELDSLRENQLAQQSDVNQSQMQLEEKYKAEIRLLHENYDKLDGEKKKIVDDYELKLSKAQAFYEKELAALKDLQDASNNEQMKVLHEQNEKLRKELQFQEGQSKQRIDELLSQLSEREEEVDKFKKQLEKLQSSLKDKDSDSSSLANQLSEAQKEALQAMTRLKEVEGELAASRERCQHQATDLIKKSTEIGELEATKMQQTSTIKDLQAELNKLKDRLGWLEDAKRALEDKSSVQTKEQIGQLKSLEKALEDMSIEKQTLIERYEKDLKHLKEQSKQREEEIRQGHKTEMEDLAKLHATEISASQREAEETLKSLKQELEDKLENERRQLQEEKKGLRSEFEKTSADLTSRAQRAEEEVDRLNKLIQQSEHGLGTATSHIDSLKAQVSKLTEELDSSQGQLRNAKNEIETLQSDYAKYKEMHQKKMEEAKEELRIKLDGLSSDLDKKWTDTLRRECSKLQQELTAQKEEDKRAALAQLTKLKDEEMAAAKLGWERKIQELLEQISSLRKALESQEHNTSSEIDKVKKAAEEETKRLMQQMLTSAEDYASKIEALEKSYKEQLQSLTEQRDQDVQDAESRLRQRHLEDMHAQMTAHKATLEGAKDAAEKHRLQDLDAAKDTHREELEALQSELEQRHSMEIEESTRDHNMQLQVARMELERALELTKQKEGEHAMKLSDLEEEVHRRETSLRHFEEENRKLQKGVNDLSKEVEKKGKEILKIRSEAHQNLKVREDKMSREYEERVNQMKADHIQESQDMLTEFTEAQEMLKEKISALQLMLEEAEDRYRNRESRPEDLQMLEKLQNLVLEREDDMKKLVEERKFLQLELVNRETNFNKVFTGDPKVGLLNPLQVGKKARGKGSPVGGRLEPLPGSPLYGGSLNVNKPLPPTKKVFLK